MMTEATGRSLQDAVAGWLTNPRHWPDGATRIREVETHISRVFLGRDIALKMKKAVRLPYLDFTTLDKRRRYCERELEINRRFSPQLYLGLVAVTREADGSLALDGDGAVVEWLVKMRRFDEDAILARVAETRGIDDALAGALAHMMARAHQRAAPRPAVDGADMIGGVIAQVDAALDGVVGAAAVCARLKELHGRFADALRGRGATFRHAGGSRHLRPQAQETAARDSGFRRNDESHGRAGARAGAGSIRRCHGDAPDSALKRVAPAHAPARPPRSSASGQAGARAGAGSIRRCHGDAHLGNIVLLQEGPALFDAIEFSDTLTDIDILYDLAFPLADLVHRGQRRAANVMLNTWLWAMDDPAQYAGCGLLGLFTGLRAAIRGMVSRDLACQLKDLAERTKKLNHMAAWLATAADCLRPTAPRIIAVGGFSGSGKTTLAAGLAPSLAPGPGAVHLRSDIERKVMAGVDPLTRLPPEAYTPEASRQVYARLMERARAAAAAGWPVVVDAVFGKPEERAAIADAARAAGVPFTGLWLEAPQEVLHTRVAARRGDASDATGAVVNMQLQHLTPPADWSRLTADGPPDAIRERAMRLLRLRPHE